MLLQTSVKKEEGQCIKVRAVHNEKETPVEERGEAVK